MLIGGGIVVGGAFDPCFDAFTGDGINVVDVIHEVAEPIECSLGAVHHAYQCCMLHYMLRPCLQGTGCAIRGGCAVMFIVHVQCFGYAAMHISGVGYIDHAPSLCAIIAQGRAEVDDNLVMILGA